MRKKIYRWHRTLSLIIAVPVILWASSGFMHPLMTNIRPHIATQSYSSPGVDSGELKIDLQSCLLNNHIDSFRTMHIVQIAGQQFYQVIVDNGGADIRYFSTRSGKALTNGDELYARFLARYFLEGDDKGNPVHESVAASGDDCCMTAAMGVMNSRGARITGVSRLLHFDGEYKYINRLLPVYKVSFDRGDGIRIYVETASSRFGFAVDDKRAAFDTFFGICHTWEWMNALGNTKYFLMVLITLTGFATTLFGLSIFFTTKTKKGPHPLVKSRRNHRYVSLVASLFTLMFTFSGGFHALDKILPKDKLPDHIGQQIAGRDIHPDFRQLFAVAGKNPVQDISLCSIGDELYWQLYLKKKSTQPDGRADLMKSQSVEQSEIIYVNANSLAPLQNGDERYARFLGSAFSGNDSIRAAVPVNRFTDEYNFINKRLPVWKISYAANGNERYYVETSTGTLSSRVRDNDLVEGYSFAFFHKHHFMDWGGKTVRDISTMFWAAMQVVMVIVGLILYFKVRQRKAA